MIKLNVLLTFFRVVTKEREIRKSMLLLFSFVLIFTGCKKGEDDPFISFRTRKARVTGNWKLAGGYKIQKYSYGAETKAVYSANEYTLNSGGNFFVGPAKFDMELKKDGSAKVTRIMAPVFSTGGFSGTWNFTDGVGETKKKAQIVFQNNSRLDYEFLLFDIKELRNKRMVLRHTSNVLNYSSIEEEYEFTQ